MLGTCKLPHLFNLLIISGLGDDRVYSYYVVAFTNFPNSSCFSPKGSGLLKGLGTNKQGYY